MGSVLIPLSRESVVGELKEKNEKRGGGEEEGDDGEREDEEDDEEEEGEREEEEIEREGEGEGHVYYSLHHHFGNEDLESSVRVLFAVSHTHSKEMEVIIGVRLEIFTIISEGISHSFNLLSQSQLSTLLS